MIVWSVVAYIRQISPSAAGGRLAQVYGEIREEVPRVPTFLQVFSLRPETMEGMYRTWLTTMWNGQVPRTTKELMALVVAKAARCDYGIDSQLVYLQATGLDGDACFAIESELAEAKALSPNERESVRFAIKLTNDPRAVQAADRMMLAKAWPAMEDRVELISTIAGHNCVVRLANALGVASEIPQRLRRFEPARRGAITMMGRLMAISLDAREKSVPAHPPEENRAALSRLFRTQLGFGSLPPGLELLDARPELFDGQLGLLQKSVAMMPRDRWVRIGLVVGRLVGCDYLSMNCADWLKQRGADPAAVIAAGEGSHSSLPVAEAVSLRFARDFTLYSHSLDARRIEELNRAGLSDGAILDLAFVSGIFNGLSRLILSLAPF